MTAPSKLPVEFHAATGDRSPYKCAECTEPVFLIDGIVYKPCGHTEAAVLADLEAIVYGAGGAS